jgi:uncharacterized protein (DUF2141 family)
LIYRIKLARDFPIQCVFLAKYNLISLKLNKHLFYIASGIFVLALVACAKLGSPSGGPIDEAKPIVIKSKPINYSSGYNRKKVIIRFDEYIVLKDQFNEFTISPPLEKKPIPQTKGKAIVIELPSSKLDTLTYTLDFGQSIEDLNEGNKLPNFQFVISKQSSIDSFTVSGKVLDAFTRKPEKERISVFLYKNLSDTAPYKVIPSYLGRTSPTGDFIINHITPGTYSVFALRDLNNNLLYDMPTEVIAFSNELLYLCPDSFKIKQPLVDSTLLSNKTFSLDSVLNTTSKSAYYTADSMKSDSTIMMMYGYSFNLSSFTEKAPYKQFLADFYRKVPENITLIFNLPIDSLIPLRLLNVNEPGKWFYLQPDLEPDTLVYWLTDTSLVKTDSVIVEAILPYTDSTGKTIQITDTLFFRNKSKEAEEQPSTRLGQGRMGKKQKEVEPDTLPKPVPRMSFESNINKSGHDLNVPVRITTGTPVLNFNEKLYRVVKFEDTLEIPVKSKFISDPSNSRVFSIPFEFEPSTNYRIDLYQGLFNDIYFHTIDSSSISFRTQRDDYYGTVNIIFENVHSPVIVQLLGAQSAVVKQQIIRKNQKVTFDFLKPGKFSIKIIADDNDNGKWDTGDYKLKLQPEKVDFYPQELDVRSNWEVEYTWEIKW